MADNKNKNTTKTSIPLKRPKGVSEKQWSKAEELYEAAVKVGDPAPALTVAQAALESAWFKKVTGKNNYFGQKGTKSQKSSVHGTHEYDDEGNKYDSGERFRDYDTLEEAMVDRQRLWGGKYGDAENNAEALAAIWQYDEEKDRGTGYATDPKYDTKIHSILGMMGVDPTEPLQNYTGDASINPKDIANNPRLDPGTKEELLRANESEGLAQTTINDINQGNNDSILAQNTVGYAGDYNLLDKTITNQDAEAKNAKKTTAPQQDALGYTGEIGAFASNYNLLDQKFNKGGSLGNCGGPGEPPCDEVYAQKLRKHNELYAQKIKNGNDKVFSLLKGDTYTKGVTNDKVKSTTDSIRHENNRYRDSLRTDSEELRLKTLNNNNKSFTQGGELDSKQESNIVTEYNTGGSHEQNPRGGIPVGQNQQGGMNMVEQGETRHNDYIYSNAYQLSKKDAGRFNIHPKYIGKSFSDISKEINDQITSRPHDRITKKTAEGNLNKLMMAQETVKQQEEAAQTQDQNNMFNEGGSIVSRGLTKGATGQEQSAAYGGILGAAGTGLALGQQAFGDTGVDISGKSGRQEKQNVAMGAAGSALKGAGAGAAFGPIGMAAGAVIGGAAGLLGGSRANKEILEANRSADLISNNQHRTTFEHGGLLHPNTGPGGKKKKTEGDEDTTLDTQDVQNVKDSTGLEFTETSANSLFEKVGATSGQPAPPNVNFGRYSDVNYFSVGNTDGDVMRINNTENNPHNPYTIQPVMEELRALNPGINMELEYKQFHKGGNLQPHTHPHTGPKLPPGAVGRTKDGVLIITGNQGWRHYGEPTILASEVRDQQKEAVTKRSKVDFPTKEEREPVHGTYVQDVMNEWANADYSKPKQEPLGPSADELSPPPNTPPNVAAQPVEEEVTQDTFVPGQNIKYGPLEAHLNQLAKSNGLTDAERQQISTDSAISGLQGLHGQLQNDPGFHNSREQKGSGVTKEENQANVGVVTSGQEDPEGGSNFSPAELLRYAPSIGNALQLMNLPDAEVERYDRLGNRYQPQYMDERAIENRVANSAANTRGAIMNASGGSQAAARASLLGSQVNETKGLSDAMMQAQQFNNNQDQTAQQFNLSVDQANQQISTAETIANAQNRGVRDTRKQQLTQGLLGDLGEMGKEARTTRTLKNLTGYDTAGNRAKPGMMASLLAGVGNGTDQVYQLAQALLDQQKNKKKDGN